MDILILNWRDIKHPLAGGAEISLMEHAKYWSNKGAKVAWFSSSYPKCKSVDEIEGIRIIRNGSHYTVHIHAFLYYLRGKFGKFDLVIDSFHFLPFFTPLYVRRKKIIALINEPAKNVWFQNLPFIIALIGYVLEPLFFKIYKKKHFITGSESIARELISNFGLKRELIHVIHHGFTPLRKRIKTKKEKNPTFIYMARISKDKGIEDALNAMSLLNEKIKNVKLWIVGKGESNKYLEGVKRIVKKNNLGNKVFLYGYVPEDKKFELLSRAWALINPSTREGWGINVIESNSVGTIAIGYNVTGLRDSIKNRETGYLTSKNNPKGLAEIMASVINEKKERDLFSARAKKWAEKFSWDKAGKKSYSLLTKI